MSCTGFHLEVTPGSLSWDLPGEDFVQARIFDSKVGKVLSYGAFPNVPNILFTNSTNLKCIGSGKSSMTWLPGENESFRKEAADLWEI